jgi:hypothetical protein
MRGRPALGPAAALSEADPELTTILFMAIIAM